TAYRVYSIHVSDFQNDLPVALATAEPNPQLVNEPVNFSDDSSYDPDGGSVVKYEWDWDNDGIFDEECDIADHTWSDPGTYYVQFKVTDDEGTSSTLDSPLEIVIYENELPIALAKAEPNPQLCGDPVNFSDDGSYDPDGGTIIKYEWDWDNDGIFDEEGDNVNHTWNDTGTYFVQFRVTDNEGTFDTLDVPLEIEITYCPENLVWAKSAGGIDEDNGYGITTLSDNSTVVTGYFEGTATFGQDEPCQTQLVSAGSGDIFIARYNVDGTLVWAKRAGGTSREQGYGITALSDDSTVITGEIRETVIFGEGESNETQLGGGYYSDIFIARYNPDGTLAWAKRAGSETGFFGDDSGSAITSLPDDSTVVTGTFYENAIFGEGEANQTQLVSSGDTDIFIARYNPDGTLAWAKQAGGVSWDASRGIAALSDDSTIVTGHYWQNAIFGAGEPGETALTTAGSFACFFIARYSADGSLAWAKGVEGNDGEFGYGITSLSDNSAVVVGNFWGTATFGPGEINQTQFVSVDASNIFIAHYNLDGTLAWAKNVEGLGWDTAFGVTTLSDNSTVLTGSFQGTATFGPGEPNQTQLISTNSQLDIFIAHYNTDGTLAWVKCAKGADREEGFGITTLSDDSTVVTGYFGDNDGDPVIFGPCEPNETVLTSAGDWDIFIARFMP
ncbi:MAG: PKD domain-containing protein, partial [bacterium]